ncbi:recombination protein F [Mariniflexile rhizosphaerae]|uniref:AAA family ATPase n=1 Tax=unclassified Mariniflexile TaxID=2643887 RepID=UPI000CB6883F|nr:AAA family ATPase [Mariniflexile sp. TRM1-10]AXP82541.1 recombination protein F [Mariniflexile sp. TRM1-10]PLB19544.1 MAG: ATPase [Flavobacteriaceae bacterium FS1-H7996/R]
MAQINLANKNLVQWPEIPNNITDIRIQNNKCTEIPDSIEKLKGLTRIIADGNNITKVSDKILLLPAFQDLRLHSNKLLDIPNVIYGIKNLAILILGKNLITKIPSEISNLKMLTQLHLQDNSINSLSKEIGQLSNLTHLYLDNNPIEFLPHSIKDLKKLALLSIHGTKLPIPPNYTPQTPENTIKYVLENQIDADEPIISFTNAYIFKNIQKQIIESKFKEVIDSYSQEIDVNFKNINSIDQISKSISIIFFLITYDSHSDKKLVHQLLEKCQKLKLNYYILLQSSVIETNINFINLEVGNLIESNRLDIQKKYKGRILDFSSYDELKGNIFSALTQHSPKIRLNKLVLTNIGHFKNKILRFDENITCLVGENGTGKSTILRALALGAIGGKHPSLDKKKLQPFLRISGIDSNGNTIYENGLIELEYSIDGEIFKNEITFQPIDDGRDFNVNGTTDSEILSGRFNLKSLIVGFPQLRSEIIESSIQKTNKVTQAHVNDLIPLIYSNEEDNRLNSFISWIVNLDVEGLQQGKEKINNKRAIVDKVFEIISEITKHDIKYIKVKSASPPDVWVSTFDSPKGVPLSMVSQGFKIIMSWVGYYLERMITSFPALGTNEAITQNAILILDEIDTSIHPKWQSEFINILRKNFTKTQFIFTTHSPLIISRLNKEQILEFEVSDNNEINLLANQTDTWSLSYNDILHKLFNTVELPPLYNLDQLNKLLENTPKEDFETRKIILENIDTLKESSSFNESIKKYEDSLKEKQNELNALIKNLKSNT